MQDIRHTQITWVEKYRPLNLDEIYLPTIIKNRVIDTINNKNISNTIITGPTGIGKTSVVYILAKEIYGKYYSDAVLELNLLDEKGIKFIQNDVVAYAKTKIPYKTKDEKSYPKYKLIILNESDNIISRIQDQISNVMEKYGEHIKFIITCNSCSEINESIQSKSMIWRYHQLSDVHVIDKLTEICEKENIYYEKQALQKIAELSQGDLRSAINKLQLIHNNYDKIEKENVIKICNLPQELIMKQLFTNIMNKNIKETLKMMIDLRKQSYSGTDITLGMLHALKTNDVVNIPENIKIKLAEKICEGIYNISNIVDSDLQLSGCMINMINSV